MADRTDTRRIYNYLQNGDKCNVSVAQLQARLPAAPHTHDFHEVFWIRHGSCRHLINGVDQRLHRGHVVFIRPTDTHRFQATSKNASLMNVVLPNEYIRRLHRLYKAELEGTCFWQKQDVPDVYLLPPGSVDALEKQSRQLEHARHDQIQLDAMMLSLIQFIRPLSNNNTTRMPDWLQAALNRAKDPKVFCQGAPGFIQVAGKGHEHVCRTTKRYLNRTPSELINEIRCEYAARELAGGSRQISEIAEYCGFENPSHFFRIFKKHFGQTPREYRVLRQHSVV